jgi:hypothetical protein
MEAAGLAIGAVSLLIELFDQSVTAYKLFQEGKELEKTSTHATAKLEIEERRLVQWGAGSGFSKEKNGDPKTKTLGSLGVDTRLLQNPALSEVVKITLTCIQDVLHDTDLLKSKYGLKVLDPDGQAEDGKNGKDTGSIKDKKAFGLSKGSHSVLSRFKWAVRDKDAFGKLLDQLKYYNDSLYSLLPVETGITIMRDVLASLVAFANDDTLRQFGSLGKQDEQDVGQGSYKELCSVASVALKIRRSTPLEQVPKIPQTQIIEDSELGCLATWRDTAGSEVRVVMEAKVGARVQGYTDDSQALEDLKMLASLLNSTVTAKEFSTMRCLGISTIEKDDVTMLYAMPEDADPMVEPITLHELLRTHHEDRLLPALDDRFALARAIASAIHQMHSAGWLHKDINSHNIIFFKSLESSLQNDRPYNIRRPYFRGFRFARRVYMPAPDDDRESLLEAAHKGYSMAFRPHIKLETKKQHENAELLQACVYQHPSYLFHRLISEATYMSEPRTELNDYHEANKRQVYYAQRHEYYSLGLILLEIGLWQPLDTMDVLRDHSGGPTGIWNLPLSISLTYNYGTWDTRALDGRMISIMRMARASRSQYLNEYEKDDSPQNEWPEEVEVYIKALNYTLKEERIVGIALKPAMAAKSGTEEHFWSLWDEVYPHACLRKDAVGLARELLSVLMGRKYRECVVRCLNADFSIDGNSDELSWLRAYNWVIVKELEKCSA